jgi:maleylpyruvate isomerase
MQDEHLAWVDRAHEAIAAAAARLSDEELAGASLLPGWTRAHVLAHIARNADGLANLVAWAATGVERPMYVSADARAADIETTAALAPDDLRADVVRADDAFRDALGALTPEAERVPVRALRGDPFPAGGLPFVRACEAWVHLVDLDAGVGFADVPGGLQDDLLAEAVERAPGRELSSGYVLRDEESGRRWVLDPEEPSVTVTGRRPELLGWLTGRHAPGGRPEPPPWP